MKIVPYMPVTGDAHFSRIKKLYEPSESCVVLSSPLLFHSTSLSAIYVFLVIRSQVSLLASCIWPPDVAAPHPIHTIPEIWHRDFQITCCRGVGRPRKSLPPKTLQSSRVRYAGGEKTGYITLAWGWRKKKAKSSGIQKKKRYFLKKFIMICNYLKWRWRKERGLSSKFCERSVLKEQKSLAFKV